MSIRLKTVIAVSLLLASQGLWAQESEVFPFTRVARGPRAAAFAGAGSASVQDVAYASFTNAAVVPFYEGVADFGLSYQGMSPSLGLSSVAVLGGAYRFGNLGVTVGGMFQLERPDYDGFRPTEYQANVGLGYRFTSWLGLGVNARFVGQTLFAGKANLGFNADAMLLFAPVKGLTLTAGVANLGSVVEDQNRYDHHQPLSVKAAAAYHIGFGSSAVEVALDEDYFVYSKSNAVSAGLEYSYSRIVFARVGYRYATEAAPYVSHLALGLGFQYWGIRLDVSYLTLSKALGNSFSVGLGYRF